MHVHILPKVWGQCRVTGTHTQCHTEEPMIRDWSPNHCRPPRLPNLRKKGAWGCPSLPRSPSPSVAGVDVIKHCDCSRWYEKIPPGGETSIWRWDLQSEVRFWLEVRPPIRVGPPFWGETSIWRWDSDFRWDLQSEVGSPFGGETSDWRWDLWSEVQMEVSAPIGGHFSFSLQRGRMYFYLLWYLLYVSPFLHDVSILVYN